MPGMPQIRQEVLTEYLNGTGREFTGKSERRTGMPCLPLHDREGEERPGKAQEWGRVDPAKQDGEVVMK